MQIESPQRDPLKGSWAVLPHSILPPSKIATVPASREVLVVEDDDLLRGLIVDLLTKRGFTVVGVATGGDAVAQVLQKPPAPVLLLDQQLPDMKGQDVVSALAGCGIKAQFIMMTGLGDERFAVDMMKFGAVDYLVKDGMLLDVLPGVLERAFRTIESERLLQATERALRESEKRFRGLFQDMTAVAVHGFDRHGVVHYWNKASSELFGYAPHEVIGNNFIELIVPPEKRGEMTEKIRRMADSGEMESAGEVDFVRRDGAGVAVFSSCSIVQMPGRDPEMFGINVDLTERKRAEADREKLMEQLSQARKMESVGRLAGGVAHDFNNMLGVILGQAELALDMLEPGDSLQERLQEIRKAAERSAELTRQLLAFARKQTVQPRVLDLNETVEGMLKMLRRLVGEHIELKWMPCLRLGYVHIDPVQVHQILTNVCENARESIADTGTIIIKTERIPCNAEFCSRHEGSIPGDHACLTVADSGIGMDAEMLTHLFEPFFTTKKLGEGTGLGLATVYGVVKQNKGFIRVESQPGKGSAFHIYFPIHASAPAVSKASQAAATRGGKETIMLVEDEPAILKMITGMLEALGYTVVASGDPVAALELARTYQGKLDLLLTDVIMPGMNGKALAMAVTDLHPGIGLIFMSGYTANIIAPHGVLDEGVHFIQKPFFMHDLSARIRDALKDKLVKG
ncbi:MAG TPA: hypothetical protein DCS43_08850 [Verrucomicrobia bacterium]|nr:hypothetical protein [Verrucomicrobiota bacterium]